MFTPGGGRHWTREPGPSLPPRLAVTPYFPGRLLQPRGARTPPPPGPRWGRHAECLSFRETGRLSWAGCPHRPGPWGPSLTFGSEQRGIAGLVAEGLSIVLGRGQGLRVGSGLAPRPLPAWGRGSPRRGPRGSASCCSARIGGRICASLCPGSSPSQLGGRAVSAQRPRPPRSAPAAPQVPGSLGTWVPFTTPREPCGRPHHPLLITLGHCLDQATWTGFQLKPAPP